MRPGLLNIHPHVIILFKLIEQLGTPNQIVTRDYMVSSI